jgi:hypothetical protein
MASLTVRNIPEDAKLRFRRVAAAHGRSMEEHLRQLVIGAGAVFEPAEIRQVSEAPVPFVPAAQNSNWVECLIELAAGAGLHIPESRSFVRHAPAYPAGMAPLPGESFTDHISRLSRPGIDLEIDRDRTPHEGIEL